MIPLKDNFIGYVGVAMVAVDLPNPLTRFSFVIRDNLIQSDIDSLNYLMMLGMSGVCG